MPLDPDEYMIQTCLHKNPYAFIEAEILDVVTETSNIKTFTFKPKSPLVFRAGNSWM